MARFTIIGTGTMGTAISGVLAKGGATIQRLDKDELTTTAIEGELVVLAVPYPALAEIASKKSAELAGRAVVDISNPLDFSTFDSLVTPADGSAAAELQALLPESRILKAFNTTFGGTLSSGTIGDATQTVLVAGDDADAKATLISAVEAGGLAGVDAGSLRRARELEALGFLQLTLAAGEKISWTGGFALTK